MLTPRGWWLLLTVLATLVLAELGLSGLSADQALYLSELPHTTAALLGLTLGLWLATEWLLFTLRYRLLKARLVCTRALSDERGSIDTLWAKRSFQVQTEVRLRGGLRLPFARISDLVPSGADQTAGETQYEGPLEPGQPISLEYRLQSRAIGRLRFEGVRLQVRDVHGFFYRTLFVRDGVEYRVLPPLADAAGHAPTVKRHNLLPPPGVHRLHRAGSGSELLDLRDYLPGDPPKTIAWKASARRDRLITKEFDSEVPLRCTLFVDTSNSVRLGPPGKTAVTQLVEIASNVIQAAAGERDLVGLCLFDDKTTEYVRPARTNRHVGHLINLLTDAASLSPFTGEASVVVLQPLAYSYARRVYPELLQPDLNHVPAWLAWWSPPPAYAMRRPTWRDRMHQWLPLLAIFYVFVCAGLTWFFIELFRRYYLGPSRGAWTPGLIYAIYAIVYALTAAMGVALLRLPAHFLPEVRRDFRWRKQLSALLSVRYGLPPGALAVMLEDEQFYVLQLQRFLAEHHVPYAPPLSESLGRSAFASLHKVEVLANALVRAVSRGHDNELFVLLVHLLEVPDQLDELLRAVRVAVARHHRVIVVCPWPEEVEATARSNSRAAARWQEAFQQVRRAFARLGVRVVPARGQDPARLILERLERLRLQGRRR